MFHDPTHSVNSPGLISPSSGSVRTAMIQSNFPLTIMEETETRSSSSTGFPLVASAFTVVYITQPVLPILEPEFAVRRAHRVLFGLGRHLRHRAGESAIWRAGRPLSDKTDYFDRRKRYRNGQSDLRSDASLRTPHRSSLYSRSIIPSHTTCIAAYLARNLPAARLNVVMGSYVAATVAGGLGGRLLGGWIHPAASLALRICQRGRLGDCSNDRRGSLAAGMRKGKKRPSSMVRQAGFVELLTPTEFAAHLCGRVRRLLRVLVHFQLSSLLSLQAAVFGAHRSDHLALPGVLNRRSHRPHVGETQQVTGSGMTMLSAP